jgi:hypothetical protein
MSPFEFDASELSTSTLNSNSFNSMVEFNVPPLFPPKICVELFNVPPLFPPKLCVEFNPKPQATIKPHETMESDERISTIFARTMIIDQPICIGSRKPQWVGKIATVDKTTMLLLLPTVRPW